MDEDDFCEETDAFLDFVEHARSMLSAEENGDSEDIEETNPKPSWSWIVSRIIKTCSAYSSGVTSAILLTDLFQISRKNSLSYEAKLSEAWNEQRRIRAPRRKSEYMVHLKKQKRVKLPNTVTIDSIYEKNFLSTSSVLETVVLDVFLLPGTSIYMLNLGDVWSSHTIDLYLHSRYYDLIATDHGLIKKGREIFLSGCYICPGVENIGRPRLLPTEFLVVLLDEDQDEDAILLGARFCSDSFSTVSLNAFNDGASYSFYARIESIGSLETHGPHGNIQKKQIILVDSDGVRIRFLLWGNQILLANLLSIGSMLALDNPFIASSQQEKVEAYGDLCLEYGSATKLYLVPYIQQDKQVLLACTQNKIQGSRLLTAMGQSQNIVSQVTLLCDSQGSIDFSIYPFRPFIVDLHDKMTGVSLYGVVTSITRENNALETIFSLKVEDSTGELVIELHFIRSWSLGRLGIGHTIYISGLSCSILAENMLKVKWFEKDPGASLVNLSCLPALLNSSCLHKMSYLSDLSTLNRNLHICRVSVDHIDPCQVNSRLSHVICGHFVTEKSDGCVVCSFCQCACDNEVLRSFHLEVTLVDMTATILAWCMGQTASELLQISPDDFYELPEDEQAMYLYTLENEIFMVSIGNSNKKHGFNQKDSHKWEIAQHSSMNKNYESILWWSLRKSMEF